MSKTNYLENAVINHILRNTPLSSPSAVYVGLSTANPGEDGSGLAEPVGNGYVRRAVTFGAPADGTTSNTNTLSFAASGGNWGTITHFALFDAASGGNMLYQTSLTASRTINDTDSAEFAVGTLTVSEL